MLFYLGTKRRSHTTCAFKSVAVIGLKAAVNLGFYLDGGHSLADFS